MEDKILSKFVDKISATKDTAELAEICIRIYVLGYNNAKKKLFKDIKKLLKEAEGYMDANENTIGFEYYDAAVVDKGISYLENQ